MSWDETEQAVRFDIAWTNPHTDRWFYPVHTLNLPQGSLRGACMVEFEVKTAQDKVENDFKCANLMLLYKGKPIPGRLFAYQSPIGSWERRFVEFGEGDHLEDATAFRLGVNPKCMKCTFWIRNLAILKKKSK